MHREQSGRDLTLIDQAVALLRTEHQQATVMAGPRLAIARDLALQGVIEPVSGDWSTDDRFWVRPTSAGQRHIVTTGAHPTCDCVDFVQTHAVCPHIWAVSILCLVHFRLEDGPSMESESEAAQEAENAAELVEDEMGIDDQAEDVVWRAIADLEAYARRLSSLR